MITLNPYVTAVPSNTSNECRAARKELLDKYRVDYRSMLHDAACAAVLDPQRTRSIPTALTLYTRMWLFKEEGLLLLQSAHDRRSNGSSLIVLRTQRQAVHLFNLLRGIEEITP